VCGYSTLVAASSDVVVGADSGVVRVEFDRWHLATLGVAASDKEWAKADADSNGLVTAAEQVAYEACCKFKKGFAMDEAELPDDDGARVCRTVEDVDTLIMDFEAKTLSADHTKEVLRQSLYELGIKRVQGDGNPYATLTTPVKTAILKELIAGAKEAIRQRLYDEKSRATLEAHGKAPAPPCKDEHEDCEFFAGEGECDNNAAWMAKNCRKSCGSCVDESRFFDPEGSIKHLQGKKGFKSHRKLDTKTIVMFWQPGCQHCTRAKPLYAESAERSLDELPDVVWAAVDCSRNEATCVKQQIEKFPSFRWYADAEAWVDGGSGSVTYGLETHPSDPSIFATTKFLSDTYDEKLLAELEYDGAAGGDEL
jgi:thiol-disulfide isomerase/thioredoxin